MALDDGLQVIFVQIGQRTFVDLDVAQRAGDDRAPA